MAKFSLFEPKEQFLVLELFPQKTQGLLFTIDENRVMRPKKQWDAFPLQSFLKRSASSWGQLRQLPWFSRRETIIVSADPTLATTLTLPVKLARKNPKEPITLLELENFFAQSIGKVFHTYRKEASMHLISDELHTILVGNQVKKIFVDKKQVDDPVGSKGREIRAVLELIFTTRDIFEAWKNFFNVRDRFFFTERTRAQLQSIAKFEKAPIHLIAIESDDSAFFTFHPDREPMFSRGRLPWSLKTFFNFLTAELGLSDGTAHQMYERYLSKDMSENAMRSLRQRFKKALEALMNEAKKAKLAHPIYIDTEAKIMLPEAEKLKFRSTLLSPILDKLGLSMRLDEWKSSEQQLFRRVAPFLEYYGDKGQSPLNDKLRRRLHWLDALVF